jgi:putative nucleotidyltransferase with HDIG domain
VARYTITLAQEMGLRGELLTTLRRGALLHDIGKIGVPDRILLKPGTLSEAEWVEMRLHPEIGARILESVDLVRPAAEIVLCHHEHFDGSGYPRGLKSHEIPLGARIFSVVDSLDAIVTPRPYRPAQTHAEAVAEIVRCRGTQFDPGVVDVFSRIPRDSWLDE